MECWSVGIMERLSGGLVKKIWEIGADGKMEGWERDASPDAGGDGNPGYGIRKIGKWKECVVDW